MSNVYFYQRKYDRDVINCWFSVRDGNNLFEINNCNLGDEVILMWNITEEMANAITNMEQDNFRAFGTGLTDKEWSVHIPLEVVKKRLTLAAPTNDNLLSLRYFGYDIFLKAVSGLWEDVLLWILLGKKPKWAVDDQPGRAADVWRK